jgi:Aldo/keto reductase family
MSYCRDYCACLQGLVYCWLCLCPLYIYALQLSFGKPRIESSFGIRIVGDSLEMSPIGIGTWQWGNEFLWNYNSKNDNNLRDTYNFLRDKDHIWFDTAEVYGKNSRSETLLGQFSLETLVNEKRKSLVRPPTVLTKFAPKITRIGQQEVVNAVNYSDLHMQFPCFKSFTIDLQM